ncbi:MAG: hypothetical protein JKX71_00780 [Amylibacter sp.]|nr:hypothetical protein [Amylibacter sp.]
MSTTKTVQSATYNIEFDQGRHHRAKIGFVLLATEQTIQDDVMALRPKGVGMHFARIATPDNISAETLLAAGDMLAPAAASLLPDGTLDVIDAIEKATGKPAICSNQAMIWDVLRLAGITDPITGHGQLLEDH